MTLSKREIIDKLQAGWRASGNYEKLYLALKIRFSAARYSFRRRSSWFTEPVT